MTEPYEYLPGVGGERRAQLFGSVRRSLVRRVAAANLAAGLYVRFYLSLIAPPPRRGSRGASDLIAVVNFVLWQ